MRSCCIVTVRAPFFLLYDFYYSRIKKLYLFGKMLICYHKTNAYSKLFFAGFCAKLQTRKRKEGKSMNVHMIICLVIFVLTIASFLWGKISMAL